jgi:hypothetical protein
VSICKNPQQTGFNPTNGAFETSKTSYSKVLMAIWNTAYHDQQTKKPAMMTGFFIPKTMRYFIISLFHRQLLR